MSDLEREREGRITQLGAKQLTWWSWNVLSQLRTVLGAHKRDKVKGLGKSSIGPRFAEYLTYPELSLAISL